MLNKLQDSSHQATVIGGILSTIQLSQIDWNKVVAGDHAEIVKVALAIGTALFGYFTQTKGGDGGGK